jgi:hypothetical protein
VHGDGRITRRHALIGAAAAAALAAAPARAAAIGTAPMLHPRRAATYRRLVAGLRGAPGGRFAHRGATPATRAFAGWYAGQDAAIRAHADAVLDRVRAAGIARYGDLERAAAAQDPLAAAAVALAAVACEPPPAEDEHPVVPPIGP